MKKLFVMAALLSAAVLVVSCSKNDVEKDKTEIERIVRNDTTHFPQGTAGDSTGGYLLDDTTVAVWWRGPQTHDSAPGIEVGVQGDSAWVSWSQHNYGDLIIWAKPTESTAVRWIKDLVESTRLSAIFLREGDVSDTDRGWRLKKISLATGTSVASSTVQIDSVRISSSIRNILIVDPLNTFYRVDSLMSFTPQELLTVTLYTNVADGMAFLHTFVGLLPVRLPFENTGSGVFSGTWNAQTVVGWLRFAVFDVLSRGTLYSAESPYDYNGWLLLYQIKAAQ